VKRGDIVLVALPGDYGKARPAVVIQSDAFNDTHPSLVICPVTSALRDTPLFRITLEPSSGNGLKKLSQIMADKPVAVKRERCGERIGELEAEYLLRLNRSLMVFLGLP
jgi:mRNA interferase MazF